MYNAIQFSSRAYYQPRKRTGQHESHRCRYRLNFIFHDRRELCGMCSCCRPFCNAIIFLSLHALMISYWNTLRLEWRRPVVVFFHIAVPSGLFSVRRRCVHSVRAVTDFFIVSISVRTTSSKLYGVPNHDDDYHIYRHSAITGCMSTWAVSSKYSAVRRW